MTKQFNQHEKALQLHQLHQRSKLLILPNIWDVLGAKLLEDIDYPAVATASAAIAYTNGFNDGQKIPFDVVLQKLEQIAGAVNIPVTADIEGGYAEEEAAFRNNIGRIIQTGVAGINIEDTNHTTRNLNSVAEQCNRIRVIRKVADELNVPLFINARADVLLYEEVFPTPAARIAELTARGIAYKEAGADCYFPIALRNKEHMQELIERINMPVNILALHGIPDLHTLQEIGVSRLSLGPGFLKIAIRSMKSLAMDLKNYDGLNTITENEITSDYLKSLINK